MGKQYLVEYSVSLAFCFLKSNYIFSFMPITDKGFTKKLHIILHITLYPLSASNVFCYTKPCKLLVL